ncbi:hypothetical protein ABZP36_031013 [Zizania latifolia]
MLPLEIKHDISERINGIVNRLHIRGKSVQRTLQLEISGHNMVSKQWRSMARSSLLTTSIPVECKLYGRDTEKDSIVELLMKGKSDDLGVLPLVGVGGVGKTTLARFVYHDQRIKIHFDLRMWVCVSDNFNEQRLTREMLELVCKDRQGHENITSFDALHQELSEKIRGKRFLLVLDDMWEDQDRSRWDGLLAPLKHNEATGCMILATTRRPSVARMIGTMSKVEVNGLDEIEFWSLFEAWAFFGSENQEADPTLQSIGKQIAKELKGSPLAVRSVGALLNRSVLSTIASAGNLTSLQELTFNVQDAGNFNIRQLGSMNELITLGISQLENVKTKEEAKSARLKDKEHLKVLSLSWNDNIMSPEPIEEKTRDDVLEGLEPHQNLKHLQLRRAWKILPLEEMRALKKLELIDVPVIEELSVPSLEKLVLIQMPSLQSCNGITAVPPQLSSQENLEFSGVNGGFGGFTSLEALLICACPKLVSSLISHCPQLGVLEGLQHLSSLRILDISMNPELSSAWDLKLQEQSQGGNHALLFPLTLGELKIKYLQDSVVHSRLLCLPSITKLELGHNPDLKSLQLGYCTALEQLTITSCKSLASIDGFHSIKNLRSLSVLRSRSIPPCLQLVSQQQWTSGEPRSRPSMKEVRETVEQNQNDEEPGKGYKRKRVITGQQPWSHHSAPAVVTMS